MNKRDEVAVAFGRRLAKMKVVYPPPRPIEPYKLEVAEPCCREYIEDHCKECGCVDCICL